MSDAEGARRDLRREVAELRRQLEHHAYRYYVLDDPEVGDDVYDEMMDRLRVLEERHPELRSQDSPTQRVGGEPVSKLEKVRHLEPMLSLANARSEGELKAWVQRMETHLAREGISDPEFRFVVEPKVDGLAISLIYRDGRLERGATRGNGEIGEDVTHNLRTVGAIPLRVQGEGVPPLLEVRGEIYMSIEDFTTLNEKRAEEGLSTFMNPRNSAAGSIRQLSPELASKRPMSIWCYQVGVTEGLTFNSHWDALVWLREHGFRVNRDIERFDSAERAIARCGEWEERRGELDFEIDGAVVKVDDTELQRRLGYVGREPRWAIAWKFAPTTAVTRLVEVRWNVGKFGDLHPYAVLEPVAVGGVVIKQASLHNEEDLARKDIRAGEDVIVMRAGDVIPQVVSPAPHIAEQPRRGPKPSPPKRCPFCGTETFKPRDSVFTKCPNVACPGRRWQLLRHFVSRGAMDIDGLGDKQVAMLLEKGLLQTPDDLYRLTEEQLKGLEGFAEISARNLIAAIEASKRRPFAKVLFALGIEEVGEVTGRSLARRFGSMEALMAASPDELAATSGIGDKTAAVIARQLKDESMRRRVGELAKVGLSLAEEGGMADGGPLAGKSFVLTGTLPVWSREQATERIQAAGGHVVGSVSKRTDYVVAGERAGSKLEKAQRLEVPVIDEEALRELVGG